MSLNNKIKMLARKFVGVTFDLNRIIDLFVHFGARNSNIIKDNPHLSKETKEQLIDKIVYQDARIFIQWLEKDRSISLSSEDKDELEKCLAINYLNENFWKD